MPVELTAAAPPASVPAPRPDAGADPQGGRYHLLVGETDWRACPEPDETWAPSESRWRERTVLADDHVHRPGMFEWDGTTGSLRLAHREAVSRQVTAAAVRRPDERRGADRDRYGNWYQVTGDARGIERLSSGGRSFVPWWSLDDLLGDCAGTAVGSPADPWRSGDHRRRGPSGDAGAHADAGWLPAAPPPPIDPGVRLAGLAVTTGHWLVCGVVDDLGGLLLFDLHAGGAPRVLRWPGDHAATPFDLTATADGGALVLDRIRRTWWRFDRHWRLRADVTPGAATTFAPVDGSAATCPPDGTVVPRGNRMPATGPRAVVDPVAIVEGPDVVLVLDRPPTGPSCVVLCDPAPARPGAPPDAVVRGRLPLTVEALDPSRPDLPAFIHDVVGQDLAWSPAGTTTPLPGPLLYVADASTSGTEAYELTVDPPTVTHRPDELPMRAWEARGLVAADGEVWYDAVGRWIPLEPFAVCNRERVGVLRTPTGFIDDPVLGRPVLGQPFDSGRPGCVWHRLFLDAEVPDGCSLSVAARASDDPALLEALPFRAQPTPYLRGGGSELPWHDPWADVTRPASPTTGTWELLFQEVTGRYAQLEITLSGNGRTSPSLRALRAWFPRFSYVHAYLPEVYQEEDEPQRFLERMLANAEGLLTEHEARLEQAWRLIEPRTAPVAAFDWLASWLGLHLEPQWSTARRRFLLRHVDRLYRRRGTVPGLRALLRIYLGCSLDEEVVFDPGARPDDPARIVEGVGPHRFRVIVPLHLDVDRAAMVTRIVTAARPAHAGFEIRSSSGLLVVGEAQVGIDTVLGESLRFVPFVIGRTELGAGVLAAAHPFEVADRYVSDRDRLGEVPSL